MNFCNNETNQKLKGTIYITTYILKKLFYRNLLVQF